MWFEKKARFQKIAQAIMAGKKCLNIVSELPQLLYHHLFLKNFFFKSGFKINFASPEKDLFGIPNSLTLIWNIILGKIWPTFRYL